jgi:hypothetical protein
VRRDDLLRLVLRDPAELPWEMAAFDLPLASRFSTILLQK